MNETKVANKLASQAAEITALREENERLKETMERARNYKGIEGYPCPLCKHQDGKFVQSCSMHSEIERLKWDWQQLANRYAFATNEVEGGD